MSSHYINIVTESVTKEFEFGTPVHVFDGDRWATVSAETVVEGQYLVHTDDQGLRSLSKVVRTETRAPRQMRWMTTADHGLVCMEATAPVTALRIEGPVTVTVDDLIPGDAIVNRGADGELEVIQITEISTTQPQQPEVPGFEQPASPTPHEETPTMSDNNTAALEARIATLEETLIATNEVVTHLQRSIVELTANHMQRIFNDEVMIDSIAQRVLIAGANAIAHKVKSSKDRAPELMVVEGYVPGSLRVTLQDDGVLVEEQVEETQEWVSGDQMSEGMADPKIQQVFGDLLIAYGAEFGRAYYVVDSVVLENFRAATAAQAATAVQGVSDAAQETTSVRLTTSDQFGNQFINEIDVQQPVDLMQDDETVSVVPASQLEAGQTIRVTRDNQLVKETVVAVESVVQIH